MTGRRARGHAVLGSHAVGNGVGRVRGCRTPRAFAVALLAVGAGNCGGEALPTPAMLPRQATGPGFVIHSDLDAAQLAFHVQWVGAFWRWFGERYVTVPVQPPLRVFLFGDPRRFLAWNRSVEGPDAMGYYTEQHGEPLLVVDLATGVGTFAHELVHHFLQTALGDEPPAWLNEGVAAFFEKILGHVRADGELELSVGYFSNWRFPTAQQHVDRYRLADVLAAGRDVDQCAARSLMLFLHRERKLEALVRAMLDRSRDRTHDRAGAAVLERVWGAPLADLERRWLDWIRAQPLDLDVGLVPRSQVLPEAEWAQWLRTDGSDLQWDESRQRYVPRGR
jgi:hypothetical protein